VHKTWKNNAQFVDHKAESLRKSLKFDIDLYKLKTKKSYFMLLIICNSLSKLNYTWSIPFNFNSS
jgi:hypothetical protein